jgi:hypothetical protein
MKKTVSILVASMFLVASAYANEQVKVASVAGPQGKNLVVKQPRQAAPKTSEQPHDYALESFGCCGLVH